MKGCYMDGHECSNVVKYHQEKFLPLMQVYEQQMVHFDGPSLLQSDPDLKPREMPIKAYFHDESSFHANENTSHTWLVNYLISWNSSLKAY